MRGISLIVAMRPMPAGAAPLDAMMVSPVCIFPFVDVPPRITLLHLAAPSPRHGHQGTCAAMRAAALPMALAFGARLTAEAVLKVELQVCLPFVLLLLAAHMTGGGVLLMGHPDGTPGTNSTLLATGTELASPPRNAPNFLVVTNVKDDGVPIPSFFGYLGLACVWLLPLSPFVSFL